MVLPLFCGRSNQLCQLIDRAWSGDLAEIMAAGTAYTREVNSKRYWYWQDPSGPNGRPTRSIHRPDNEETRRRINLQKDLAEIKKDRLDLVRSLRAVRAPAPDGTTGAVLAALSAAGLSALERSWSVQSRSNATVLY